MTADPRGGSVNEAVASQQELQAQLYRYAEDMHLLMSEHDALQHRFRALESSTRSVSEYRDLLSTLMHSASDAYLSTDFTGVVVSSTRSVNLILGREDIVGTNLLAMASEPARAELASTLRAALEAEGESESVHQVGFQTSVDHAISVFLRMVVPARKPGVERLCHWVLRPRFDDLSLLADQGGARGRIQSHSRIVFRLEMGLVLQGQGIGSTALGLHGVHVAHQIARKCVIGLRAQGALHQAVGGLHPGGRAPGRSHHLQLRIDG